MYNSDDITFCADTCDIKICMRHPSNIRCNDIPHAFSNFKDTKYCPKKAEAKKFDCPTNEWISVTDRLPDEDGTYLVFSSPYGIFDFYKVISFATNLEDVDEFEFEGKNRPGWYEYDSEYGFVEEGNVSHWMPIPDPPKIERR